MPGSRFAIHRRAQQQALVELTSPDPTVAAAGHVVADPGARSDQRRARAHGRGRWAGLRWYISSPIKFANAPLCFLSVRAG